MDISPMEEARQPAPLRHSGLGIASFVMVFVFWAGGFALLVVAGFMEASSPDGLDENSPEAVVIGLLYMGVMLGTLIGVALAIGGLVQKDRHKIFAVLACVFHALTFLGLAGILVLGLAMS